MPDYSDTLSYINTYWTQSQVPSHRTKLGSLRNLVMHIGSVRLPNPIVSPNDKYFAGTQFYWDSYFTIIGLVVSGQADIAKGMVDNLCHLFGHFGLVPARNSLTSVGRSQPPFLTRMAYEVYEAGGADKAWLDKVMQIAANEYENIWCGRQRRHHASGLSRYRPRFFKRLLTTYESGWDVSSRFAHGRTTLLPIDLNCLLLQYERDLARWAESRGDKSAAQKWQARLLKRQKMITKYNWDKRSGFYFDYDLRTQSVDKLHTLAGFFPLWCGAASPEQAAACLKKLEVFEHENGLADTEPLPWRNRQWDYPNGWAPLQYIVIDGLRRYGFESDAARLTRKWLNLNQSVLSETGKLWEKYDVVNGGVGLSGRYPTQPGFAWTNAVFVRLLHDLKRANSGGKK